jgi:predicted nuclease with TOPRIM domain
MPYRDNVKFQLKELSDEVYKGREEIAELRKELSQLKENKKKKLEGGTTDEYYHLTSAEHVELNAWLKEILLKRRMNLKKSS